MAKRFTDTNKFKKSFHRSLPGPYKLFWDYLYHDCDHAGIWHVDMEIAQIYLGTDMPVDKDQAIELFNTGEERIVVLNGGSKWFVKPFIDFQYGDLNPQNRAHASVLSVLSKEGIKPLTSPLQGAMDKDKDKDKDKDRKKVKTSIPENFTISSRVEVWAKEKGFSRLSDHLESFKRKVSAHNYKYVDWDAAFMEAIRENWGKIGPARDGPLSETEKKILKFGG